MTDPSPVVGDLLHGTGVDDAERALDYRLAHFHAALRLARNPHGQGRGQPAEPSDRGRRPPRLRRPHAAHRA